MTLFNLIYLPKAPSHWGLGYKYEFSFPLSLITYTRFSVCNITWLIWVLVTIYKIRVTTGIAWGSCEKWVSDPGESPTICEVPSAGGQIFCLLLVCHALSFESSLPLLPHMENFPAFEIPSLIGLVEFCLFSWKQHNPGLLGASKGLRLLRVPEERGHSARAPGETWRQIHHGLKLFTSSDSSSPQSPLSLCGLLPGAPPGPLPKAPCAEEPSVLYLPWMWNPWPCPAQPQGCCSLVISIALCQHQYPEAVWWEPLPWLTSLYWAGESERNRCFKGSINPWR